MQKAIAITGDLLMSNVEMPAEGAQCCQGTCQREWQTMVANDEGKLTPYCNEHGKNQIDSRGKTQIDNRGKNQARKS